VDALVLSLLFLRRYIRGGFEKGVVQAATLVKVRGRCAWLLHGAIPERDAEQSKEKQIYYY